MHELSITQSLVDTVLGRTGKRAVKGVNLRIGRLSGVLPDAVRFCFELVSVDTPLAGAVLRIDEPQGRIRCRSCHRDVVLPDTLLLCTCGSADVEVTSGRELMVMSVEVGS
ncbi:hydrogenase maturation nickel metallochaperone HypA [Paenarthrobacter sp. Z7-10]|uniref:hydrogenase maturation nickel metallochaperone HypA/HybF n=1 Tax=Paenarthrobacter sp. Z7-10 TaxID=2787635 RepID=UPI0022A949F2|nr:hydrogenase maturation nickel metallochaperone HypA [Paenarthrobacter sp. Z7-10]MCZ2403489.1 hydrogenase maturation nickel metallochaperone HypA [Paenarthrobacter sp. Z7-10]